VLFRLDHARPGDQEERSVADGEIVEFERREHEPLTNA
jgi:hypothetical protein